MRIAIVGMKGGLGKTTTAVYLAELAAREGPTALIDADPEPTAADWDILCGGLTPSVFQLPVTTIPQEVSRLGDSFMHFVIDCPPGHRDITKAAMLAAELLVMPVSPSMKDISKLRSTIEIAENVRRPLVMLMVKYRRWTLATKRAERALIDQGVPLLRASVGNHTAFEVDMDSVPSHFYGYDAVWDELKQLYRRLEDAKA